MKIIKVLLLLVPFSTFTFAKKDVSLPREFPEFQSLPLESTITFGLPYWAEIMIGFSIGTPVQSMKLFFPQKCIRNILQVIVESFDFYVFYQFIVGGDTIRGSIFTAQSLFSIIIELPQILSTCLASDSAADLGEILSAFSDSIMYLLKFFVYIDTSINFLFQEQWILAGYYGMTSLLSIVSFIAFKAFNS